MAGLFALSFVRDYAVFHPWKDKMFHFYTLIEVNCTFWNLIAQPNYCLIILIYATGSY